TVGNIRVHTIGPGDLGGPDFTRHATATRAVGGATGHGFDASIDFFHHGHECGLRIEVRISGVEPVSVGQEDQHISIHEVTHHRRQGIVVSEADFLYRYRVVFVNNRDHTIL